MITNVHEAEQLREKLKIAIKQAIETYYEEHPNTKNFTRNRKLPLETMLKLLISMEGGNLQVELFKAGLDVSAAAFSKQRQKIDYTILENVLYNFNALCDDTKKLKGYRVFAVDGTTINMARNPDSDSFVHYSTNPIGFNQLHLTPLYDIFNKTFHSCVIQPQPQEDEVAALTFMAKWYDFNEDVLIVADRGFESYNLIAHLLENKDTKFLIRIRQGYSAMTAVAKLPLEELDTDVSFTITTRQTKETKEKGYVWIQIPKKPNAKSAVRKWDFGDGYEMKFRVVRVRLDNGELETLATNLPRDWTPDDIKSLYFNRWKIETAFRELKYSLGLVNIHGKSDECVKQEIYALMIMANFTNRIINDIVLHTNDKAIHEYKVNTKMAIKFCREFFRDERISGKKLINNISKYVEPIRENRPADERFIRAKGFSGFGYRIYT